MTSGSETFSDAEAFLLPSASFAELDPERKAQILRRLRAQWGAPEGWQTSPAERTRLVSRVLDAQVELLKSRQAPRLHEVAGDSWLQTDVESLQQSSRVFNEVVLCMASAVLNFFRPLLEKQGFEDSLVGLARMEQTVADFAEGAEMSERAAWIVFSLCFCTTSVDEKQKKQCAFVSTALWKDILAGRTPPACCHASYIQHLALAPLERQRRSMPRTVAWAELACMHWADLDSEMGARLANRGVVWILGATHGLEGQLAQEGLFEDAVAFKEGQMAICLVGDERVPGTWPCGCMAKVTSHTWEEALGGSLPEPSAAFCFDTGLGTLQDEVVKKWLPRLAHVLAAGGHGRSSAIAPVLVMTSCCEEEACGEAALLSLLGLDVKVQCWRNLFSGMAANPDLDYDEAGWLNLAVLDSTASPSESLEVLSGGPSGVASARAAALGAEAQRAAGRSRAGAEELRRAPTGSRNVAAGSTRSPAVFWGILDLKYEPSCPPVSRVHVLETGDGRASRFSGYGATIKEAFQQENKLEDSIRCAVLTDNKKITHDTIVDIGYAHLRPRQLALRRAYRPELARTICRELGLDVEDKSAVVVLKLCNRARGAGVVPVHCPDLDAALQMLLKPPADLERWLLDQPSDWAYRIRWGCMEEQARHWWCNECPVFLVEELCRSAPTVVDGKPYDGTMRVSFSLHREVRDRLPPGWIMSPEGPVYVRGFAEGEGDLHAEATERVAPRPWDDDRPYLDLFRPPTFLRLRWLGGYWKLPLEDASSDNLRDKIISRAKQGTAPVAPTQLHDVYACLGDMVSVMFNSSTHHNMSHTGLTKRYAEIPELGAYLASRLSISMRMRQPERSRQILQLAGRHLEQLEGPAKGCVLSYIRRNLGVHEAMHGRWKAAAESFRLALQDMPENAAARYLLAMAHLESGEPARAAALLEQALQLDPDLKALYVNLAVARLRLGHYDEAAEASAAGLKRHPENVHCQYNLGVALFARAVRLASHSSATAAPAVSGAAPHEEPSSRRQALYSVVHERVVVRKEPSTASQIISLMRKGEEAKGLPCRIDGEHWLHLGTETCKRSCIPDGWMLMHGRSLGLGVLLAPAGDHAQERAAHDSPLEPEVFGKEAVGADRCRALSMKLKAEALEALVVARDGRFKETPWMETDKRMVATLQDPGLPVWPLQELPRDGWRFHTWRA